MDDLMQQMAEQHATQRDASIAGQIGLQFRQTIHVAIVKPWWMPEDVYRRLMRTIVIEESIPAFTIIEE